MPSTARLLFADADASQALLFERHLQAQGYAVTRLADGQAARRQIVDTAPDLALLARDLPGLSGAAVARDLRARGATTPILLLSPGDDFVERVKALDAGADDVLATPCALEELSARIRALLRRSRMGLLLADGPELTHKDLVVNTDQRQVSRAGVPIKLTVKEYDLLLHLLRHKQQVLPRQQILLSVWGDSWVGSDNLLDVYIRYLRKKLEGPDREPLIHTVRGVGFSLD
ncbi:MULTISPECIES: response regulator transcription factor [Aphanothece]|uniref:response regulator transcription factor n=1 Tax=Aphanothece TaxID=1121 RepID=UPI003984E3C4